VADDRKVPSVYLLVESPTDADFMRQLLAYADVPVTVVRAGGEMARERLVPGRLADHELVIVTLTGERPPAELMSAITSISGSSQPVLLLAVDRDTAAKWPPALQNLPVVFTDGDAEAIGERLRATIRILVSDHRKKLAEQARRAAARAQRSAESHQVASQDVVAAPRRRVIARERDLANELMVDAVDKLADADALVEDFLGQPPPSGVLPRNTADRLSRLVSQAREDLATFFEQRFDAHLVQRVADRAIEAPDRASSSIHTLRSSRYWDVAIWVDVLGSPSFNPVLVKFGRDSDQKAGLWESMSELDLPFGLYVHEDSEPAWELDQGSIVVSIGARQLTGLSKRQFRELMAKTRDRLVHAQP
jgi:hypothetical protein